MDPDATLAEIRRLAYNKQNLTAEDAEALAEHFIALDGWLLKGGYVPVAWQNTMGAGPIYGCDANGEPITEG